MQFGMNKIYLKCISLIFSLTSKACLVYSVSMLRNSIMNTFVSFKLTKSSQNTDAIF